MGYFVYNTLFFTDRWQRSEGALLMKSLHEGSPSIEAVRDNWAKITDMDTGDFPTSNQGATMDLVGKLQPLSQGDTKSDTSDNPVRKSQSSL